MRDVSAHFVSLESPTDVTGYFRSSRWGRVSPVLSVILVFYIWDHNSASGLSLCRFQFMSDPLFWELGRTFHFLRLKHNENLLGFILSRTHWLSCFGFCFICYFCIKSSSKRVPILFYARSSMLVLGGPTTFRGVSNKKGGPVALPRKVLKYYTL